MIDKSDALTLIELIKRKAPEYLDLLTAETEKDFEQAFEAVLEQAVSHLERNKKNFAQSNEVSLTAVLAGRLSIPGLTVTQEAHSNGHVDLTIEADHCQPARIKLAEAKIYDGPSYHVKGLDQLLGRYTTGRETRGLLIVYVRAPNIASVVKGLRQRMDADRPHHQSSATADHSLKWSFVSTHLLHSGDLHQVSHVGCNLCTA